MEIYTQGIGEKRFSPEEIKINFNFKIHAKTYEQTLNEGIKKVDEFYSTPTGYQYVVFLTIYVDGNLSTFASHNLADSLERDICKLEKISKAIVHVNPI